MIEEKKVKQKQTVWLGSSKSLLISAKDDNSNITPIQASLKNDGTVKICKFYTTKNFILDSSDIPDLQKIIDFLKDATERL